MSHTKLKGSGNSTAEMTSSGTALVKKSNSKISNSVEHGDLGRSSSQPVFGGKLKKLFFGRMKSDVSALNPSSSSSSGGSKDDSNDEERARLENFISLLRDGAKQGPSLEIPTSLHLTKYMLSRILQELRTLTSIDRIVLPEFNLDDAAFAALNEGMDGNWALKTVNLNQVIKPSWKGLEDFMRNTLTLQTLELSDQGMPPETKEVIRKYLEENGSYTKVIAGERTRLFINRRGIKDMENIKPLLRTNLVHLNLSDNLISCLNDRQLETLTGLEELTLRNNQLRTLPGSLGLLCKLKKLDVSSNKLANLPPDAFCRLTCLTSLDVSNNKLSDLFSLVNLPKSLKKLLAFGNPLSLPNDVLDEGERLIPYLQGFRAGVKPCYRTKLMIVGDDKAGKTSLAYALVGKKPKKTTSADSVDIIDWQVKTNFGPVEFSVWDFAGSEAHYNEFFIGTRALYIIVFSLTDSYDLRHWLQTLATRAKESLVIVVGTHMDKVDKKRVQTVFAELKSKYESFQSYIVDFIAVSSKPTKGIEELRLALFDTVLNRMPHLPEMVPETYLRLEQTLKEICDKCRKLNEPPVKTFVEFTTIAGACGITDDEVAIAAGYLNNMGVIAYYRRVTSKEYVVLDPRWIINMFSAIVAAKDSYMKQGLLDIRDLRKNIWKPPAYTENLHDFMIALLQKFELVYKLPAISKYRATYNQSKFTHEAEAKGARGFLAFAGDETEEENDTSSGTLLFPSMLEDFASEEEFEEKCGAHWPQRIPETQQELGRNYHFNFLPLGLVSRLVARFLNTSGWEPLVYWKNGILMVKSAGKQSSEDALRDMMMLRGHSYEIRFNVRGKNPGMHLVNLAESIETLVIDSLNMECNVSVTCTHCLKEGSPHPFFFPIKKCEQAVAEGNGMVLCHYRRQISVSEMAPDISLSGIADLPHIPHSEINFGKQIGEGAFAKVFIGEWGEDHVAIKKMEIAGISSPPNGDPSSTGSAGSAIVINDTVLGVFTDFRREVLLMSSLRHKNIVALKGVVMEPFCVVMELMPHGTLFEMIHDPEKQYDVNTSISLAKDIAEAMYFLHNIPLVHRDLKSPNILLTQDKATGRYVAKVADFGLSRKVLLSPSLKGKVVDNPVWLAPEAIRGEAFSFASDVYAFGVILWELFRREKFFGELRFTFQIEDAVLNGERPPLPDKGCPADCVDMINESWDGFPEKRPSFEKILERLAKVESKLRMLAAAKKKAEELKAAEAAAAAAAAPVSPPATV